MLESVAMKENKSILATMALPYANGPLHLGHLVEGIQADIWVRFQRLQGKTCHFVCGSDAHGTSIMLSADAAGIPPTDYVTAIQAQHHADYATYHIAFDLFHTTHSPENQAAAATIFKSLLDKGDIVRRTIKQLYDEEKQLFLADRFIKGCCPRCRAADQYGDNCEVCGATYDAQDLIDPYSTLSGTPPVSKETEHFFFQLSNYTSALQDWLSGHRLPKEVTNKLQEWFDSGLKDWDITRDAPYFGVEIPDAPGKYFYVWLDAPIGYMSIFKLLCDRDPSICYQDFWSADATTALHHFIGKDIVNFHALFWPAVLEASGHRKPSKIHVHGYLTINGQKMSKSRKTYITAKDFAEHCKPDMLRYYIASKLNGSVEDIDLNFDDFAARVNADLVGKFINLASRSAGFIHKHHDGVLADTLDAPELHASFVAAGDAIAEDYQQLNTNRALRNILALADQANQYIDQHKPWAMAKADPSDPAIGRVCSQGINLFRLIALYLKPVLPALTTEIEQFLNIAPMTWSDRHHPLLNHPIAVFKPLMQRVKPEAFDTLLGQHDNITQ